jgi:hypothetical protein
MKKESGAMKPGKKAVGNQEISNKGYSGGQQMGELIGAKKIKGHKV